MGKTIFIDGNPAEGIEGSIVLAEFLNAINNHRHTGQDVDGAGAIDYANDAGEANAYEISLVPAITSNIPGMPIFFKAANANTGASTLDVNGIGAVAIKKYVGSALTEGDIAAGQIVEVVYDGTNFQIVNSSAVNTAGAVSFRNLKLSGTGASAVVSVSADEITLYSANGYKTVRGISLSLLSTLNTGANGLDSGSIAYSTWYAVFCIYNPTTGDVAGLLSASATSPTLPDGYTHYARVGWILTGSSDYYPIAFNQCGRRVQYVVTSTAGMPSLCSGSQGSYSDTTPTWQSIQVRNVTVPPTASAISMIMYITGDAGSNYIAAAPNSSYQGNRGTVGKQSGWAYCPYEGFSNRAQHMSMDLESDYIYVAAQSATGISVAGWEDNL